MTHVAQNPTDWKHVHFSFAKPGSIVGCDFAGEVIEVGKEATGSHFDSSSFYSSAVTELKNSMGL